MRQLIASGILALLALLTGCDGNSTTYTQVRSETLDTLQTVSDFVPEPKDVLVTPEFEPYSCSDGLILNKGKGAFYTGQWALFVPDNFDIPSFVEEVPGLLGEEWHVEELGIPADFAEVYLVRESPRMSLKIEESTIDDRKAIDLLAISRCGSISDEERSQDFPTPTPRPAP